MLSLPAPILSVLSIFLPLFSIPTYKNFLLLFQGHILSKGRRTIADLLRQLGLKNIKNYSKYHDFFRKAKWSTLTGAKILILSIASLIPGPLTFSIDATVERRKGPKIKGLAIQRDAVRSTKARKVLVPGLNWLVCSINITLPWSKRNWALPIFTVLMPPENPLSSSKNKSDLKKSKSKSKKHKTLNEWACQIVKLLRRILGPSRKITIIADSAFATYILANTCIDSNVHLVSRMRLDSRLFEFPPLKKGRGRKRIVGSKTLTFQQMLEDANLVWENCELDWYGGIKKNMQILTGTSLWYTYGVRPVPIKWVLIKDPAGNQEATALFSTDMDSCPIEIVQLFISRWQIEVTFEEVRRHLGLETQRQWSDKAIDRITPCILASYTIINLMALELHKVCGDDIPIQTAAWYNKTHVTFSDVLAYVRGKVLREKYFLGFDKTFDPKKFDINELITLMEAA